MAITFIEGLPCAGKSLLTKRIALEGLVTIDELGRVIDPSEFPGNGDSPAEIENIDEWFIDRESNRMSVEGYYDRSFLTHLTFAFAYNNYMDLDTFKPTVERYHDAIELGKLVLPENIVFVEISPAESIKRQLHKINIGRRPLAPFWRSQTFLEDISIAYDQLLTSSRGINILDLSGKYTTEENFNIVKQRIEDSPKPASQDRSLNLNEYICRLLE